MTNNWGLIGSWRMALEGIVQGEKLLKNQGSALEAIELVVKMVEDYPRYKSVGFGGLPNEEGEVELDAAIMDGDSLSLGAVAGIRDYKNPVSIAKSLMDQQYNIFLVGQGAEKHAHRKGFERKNMLTEDARKEWEEKLEASRQGELTPYDGHDTVGLVGLDQEGRMATATSTSGLFMKKPGRIGDSPIPGSGYYVDSEIGGASATGLGEDIMKFPLSYEIVRLMGEGYTPQDAAEKAVFALNKKLIDRRGSAGDISVVCMNRKGEWGAATNIDKFSFVVATSKEKPTVYIASYHQESIIFEKPSQEWIDTHTE